MPWLYAAASWLAFAVAWPLLFAHPKLRQGIRLRLGLYPRGFLPDAPGRPRLWLHGASAGDLLALLPVYRELRARRPDALFVVSTMTDSGAAIARARFADADALTFLPYDVPFAVSGAVRAIRPDVLVLEYTELWPGLIRAVRAARGRVVLTNGRLSERNVAGYRRLFALVGNLLAELDLLLMRDEAERERALALGAAPDRVRVTGNTKFDTLLLPGDGGPTDGLAEAFAIAPGDLLWVAGSTHEGEEGPLVEVFARLRLEFPALRLVLAPRYVDRAERIVALAGELGFEATRRSAGRPARAPVVVLDTIGELAAAYRLATVVFVGGSFTSRGGQNILEPASCGKAVLFGPHMENFRDSVQVLVGRGGIQVNDAGHLESVLRELLQAPAQLDGLGALAKAAVGAVRGASARDAEAILSLLPVRP